MVSDEPKENVENGAADGSVANGTSAGSAANGTPFEEAVALTGHGRFHYLLLTVCGWCLISMIFESLAASYVTPAAQCDFAMSSVEKGILNGAIYVGMIASSHMWGFVADTRGRHLVLTITLSMDFVCSVVAAFMPNLPLLVTLRFINGICICGPSAVTYAYLGEFHAEKTRTRSMVYVCVFIAFAIMAQPALAWAVIPQPWDVDLGAVTLRSWRVFLILGALPSAVTAVALKLLMPESPKFLLTAGRHDAALDVLRGMFASNTGQPPEKYPVSRLAGDSLSSRPAVNPKSPAAVAAHMWRQTAPLFRRPYLLTTVLACIIQFGLYASSNGFLLWLPDMLNRLARYSEMFPDESVSVCQVMAATSALGASNSSHSPTDDFLVADNSSWSSLVVVGNWSSEVAQPTECRAGVETVSFQNTLITGAGSAVAYISVSFIIRVVTKKTILAVCLGVSGLCGVAMLWAETELQVLMLPLAFMVLSGMCVSVTNMVVVDAFPTSLRAMAVCLSLCCGRLGTFVTSLMLGALIDYNCVVAICILGGFVFACGVLSIFLPNDEQLRLMRS